MLISVVMPAYNESESLPILIPRIDEALGGGPADYEIVCVNDGSTDDSRRVLDGLAAEHGHVKVIHLRRNYGQTAALMAGIDHSTGDVVVPIDADLQNDPRDISKLVAKLDEGFDVVSGWRRDRKDAAVARRFPSWAANLLISWLAGIKLHDYGCTLKAYRRDILKEVRLYGEMHRFIPIYAASFGARVCELPVNHEPRRYGRSRYSGGRAMRVLLDLVVVVFLLKALDRPMQFFGKAGMYSLIGAFLAGLLALYLRFFVGISFILTPLPLLVVLLAVCGILCILLGVIAELLMRVYFETGKRQPYLIAETRNL